MTAHYPTAHTIQFISRATRTEQEQTYSTLMVSLIQNDLGPSLLFQIEAPMKILTSQETRDLIAWLSERLISQELKESASELRNAADLQKDIDDIVAGKQQPPHREPKESKDGTK